MKKCTHRRLEARTEKDGCYWLVCANTSCRKRGPRKHSLRLAFLTSIQLWGLR